jgi:Bacterial Ig-like domain (group 2)
MLLSRSSSFLPLVLLAGLLTAGCEPSDPSAKPVPALVSLANSPASVTLAIGATQSVAVSGQYSDGSNYVLTNRVSFSSANTAVATVSSGGVITAVAAGSTTVTATDAASGKTGSTSVTVPAAVPVSIAIEPRNVSVTVDATQALVVTATYPNASTGTLSAGLVFSSSNAAVASVSEAGVIRGVAAGTTTVSVTHTPSGRSTSANVTVTAATQAYAVLDFGNAALNITLTPFGGEVAALVSTGVPPGGPAGSVARINRAAGSQCWAGTTVSIGARQSVGRLPFSDTLKTLTVLMHVPSSGMSVKLKAENADDPAVSVETDVVAATAGWQTLSFDFGQQSPGTAALNTSATYNKISLFPNFSCPAGGPAADEVFHVALVSFPGASGPSAPPLVETPTGQSYTVLDFNTPGTTYTLTAFGDQTAELTSTGVPAGGPGGTVVKVFEPVSAQCWAGTTLSTGPNASIPTLPVSATAKVLTAQFHSPANGLKIKLKIENAADPNQSVETDVTASAGWQTLSFDFGTQSPGTAAIDYARTYNKLSVFSDFTCGAPAATVDQTFYVGPITFIGAAAPR